MEKYELVCKIFGMCVFQLGFLAIDLCCILLSVRSYVLCGRFNWADWEFVSLCIGIVSYGVVRLLLLSEYVSSSFRKLRFCLEIVRIHSEIYIF